jgi:hypothetical protein
VETHHGGNVKMKRLLDKHPDRYKQFLFSILQILPKTITEDSVIKAESLYKKKLMSLRFGLDEN